MICDPLFFPFVNRTRDPHPPVPRISYVLISVTQKNEFLYPWSVILYFFPFVNRTRDPPPVPTPVRPSKNELIFYQRNSRLCGSLRYSSGSEKVRGLNILNIQVIQWQRSIPIGNTKNWPSISTFSRRRWTSFHVVVLQRTAKNVQRFITHVHCYCFIILLSLLFGVVLVPVVVVVCSNCQHAVNSNNIDLHIYFKSV